jgi:hypothetical protein
MRAFPVTTAFILVALASTQSHAQFDGGRREGGPGGGGPRADGSRGRIAVTLSSVHLRRISKHALTA